MEEKRHHIIDRQISRRKLADSGKWLEEKKKISQNRLWPDVVILEMMIFMLKSEDVISSFLDILLYKIWLLNKGAFKPVF